MSDNIILIPRLEVELERCAIYDKSHLLRLRIRFIRVRQRQKVLHSILSRIQRIHNQFTYSTCRAEKITSNMSSNEYDEEAEVDEEYNEEEEEEDYAPAAPVDAGKFMCPLLCSW